MKQVLITGAAGFIGSHLCDRFIKEGWYVVGVDNFLTGSLENLEHLLLNQNFELVEEDVIKGLEWEGHLDLILHFACPASPVDYLNFPIETLMVDSVGTSHTLKLAKDKRARYVFASTSEVYGDPQVHPQPESYWGNVNPVGPRSVYDEAKRFSEALSMAYHRECGVDVRIIRIFNTYGPRMKLKDGRVVPNFIFQALNGQDLTVYGDGSQSRSFCYVDDLVEGIFLVSDVDAIKYRVMNLGNPDEYKIIDFAQIILEKTGSNSKIIFKPLPRDDPKMRKPDISLARESLHWKPVISLDEGLAKTIQYFQSQLEDVE
ncbi:MAG TPA: SDR family oxidoreductase [Methanobacteriaceae archaeon]|nr:SDR family oxidoreductase [Methanobacteriaceae archaeon]HNS25384.1 SDR family oxidoreductase [Methanobacteriaceae archaeon]